VSATALRPPATRAQPPAGLAQLAIDDARWTAFTAAATPATPFHHPAWAGLLGDVYRFPAFALTVTDGAGRLLAGVPVLATRRIDGRRRWIALPFTDELPLLGVDAEAVGRLALELADAQARRALPPLEVRGPVDVPGWHARSDAVIHVLDLRGGADEVQARFDRSQVRRNIKRAAREGVVVREGSCPADMDAYYALHLRTRVRQGVPVQPRAFFAALWSRMVAPGLGSVVLAEVAGRPVAGAVFLSHNGTTIYKFGASDPAGWPQRPNHAIFWHAIQQACARGDRWFDFGRTDLTNDGLRAFKSGWGARERPLVYSTPAPAHRGGASRLMAGVIRRGPGWLCEGLGETMYRYAASR
jgi:CelD/BcsL family acetyltransferase involved in cellulose biosynthesis